MEKRFGFWKYFPSLSNKNIAIDPNKGNKITLYDRGKICHLELQEKTEGVIH